MKKFMDEDFLLTNKTASKLYHDYAENLPIIDYHCHLSPKEIYDDKPYENIAEIWLSGDHYKWRAMRANGVPEKYFTEETSDYEKFKMWAETLEAAIGNPLFHWSHLELKRYFGYDGVLNRETCDTVWNHCNDIIKKEQLSPRKFIKKSGVKVICTTDDPADDLIWHEKLRWEDGMVSVYPSFRPDKALYIEKADYAEYIKRLSDAVSSPIRSFAELIKTLKQRMDQFDIMGCRVSDHGLSYVMYEDFKEQEADRIFKDRLRGKDISESDERKFKTALLVNLAKEYKEKNWVMQLHFGVQRDLNRKIYERFGADAGIDAISDKIDAIELGRFLNALNEANALPKTILYSLNPADNAILDSIIGCFQDGGCVSKIQHGAAWWFNDHKTGIIEHLTSVGNMGLLGNFIGMLTDSRSFLSYARHEYFRRILCDFIGNLVEAGEYPDDENMLKKIVEGICYKNAERYFDFC